MNTLKQEWCLKHWEYPEPVAVTALPDVPQKVYEDRIAALRKKMEGSGISHCVVYGDREHFPNLRFLTGYDPRFEEALLIVGRDSTPFLLVGNEGLFYAKIASLPVQIHLYHPFGLQGQPRHSEASLRELLDRAGVDGQANVGVVGHKFFTDDEFGDPSRVSDIPAYIMDCLRSVTGDDQVQDVTSWFSDATDGFRIPLCLEEIARAELATQWIYAGMRRALFALEIGVSEIEVAACYGFHGAIPLSSHIIAAFGANADLGLASPTFRTLARNDFVNLGHGVWGANAARSGIAAEGPEALPAEISDAVEKVYAPYFKALRNWYKALRVGAAARDVHASVQDIVCDPFFGITLNAGHQGRDEEWINAPFRADSEHTLVSGTLLQCDIIVPASPPYSGIHTEDGLILADEALRRSLASEYPDIWERMQKRRRRMEMLGYELHEDVLPLSDVQGCVAPFMLRPNLVLHAF